jgi:glucose-1-phosphate cytidylyltransferase
MNEWTSYMKNVRCIVMTNIQTELPNLQTVFTIRQVNVRKDIPVVILAGGKGTRIVGKGDPIPKPLIPVINGKPLLWHIIKQYAYYGYKEFYVLGGFLREQVSKYVNEQSKLDFSDLKVTVFNTGEETQTGGRIARIGEQLCGHPFMFTYGDGISNVDLNKVGEEFYKRNIEGVITVVHPPSRFGTVKINDYNRVESFYEKPEQAGWINGGFGMFSPNILNRINGDESVLERHVLPWMTEEGLLYAYKHEGFWHCVDTPADLEHINSIKYVPLPYLNNR